jgi:hypothetical protein
MISVPEHMRPDWRQTAAAAGSLLLHLALLALLWLWPSPPQSPPPAEPLTVELVAPPLPDPLPLPAATATTTAMVARRSPHRAAAATAAPPPPLILAPTAEQALTSQLDRLARLPAPIATPGSGAAGPGGGRGTGDGYGLRDLIKAQIEKRWVIQPAAMLRNDWVVRIALLVNVDGTVGRAEIEDDPRLHDDSGYRDFAFSARNAALLSSPLILPPGSLAAPQQLVLDFNPRQVGQ